MEERGLRMGGGEEVRDEMHVETLKAKRFRSTDCTSELSNDWPLSHSYQKVIL